MKPSPLFCEDIPLQTCDRLPVVQITISGRTFLFLVDTAATSMLNLKSFYQGDERSVSVTSWSGTTETHAREITLRDFAVGEHHFKLLKLPAIDLSSIGHACGRRIDGILGIDLLSKLKAAVDLENQPPHLSLESRNTDERMAELHHQSLDCEAAFNRADEAAFSDCLSPSVVLFTSSGDYYGREASMDYFRRRYFQRNPLAQLSITPRAQHTIGNAVWVEYDLRITQGQQVMLARGTALWEKIQGRWRIVHLNHSAPPPNALQVQAAH